MLLLVHKSYLCNWNDEIFFQVSIRHSCESGEILPLIFHFHALEKEMATHSSVLALRIPGMGEPGGLPSMGSHRVGHD